MRMIIVKLEKQKKNQDYLEIIGENELSHQNFLFFQKCGQDVNKLIKLNDLLYFIAAPTLCFQFEYPRTQKIRKIWLIKRIAELIISLAILT
jgi:diacylglycerol O-acyltransferase-1